MVPTGGRFKIRHSQKIDVGEETGPRTVCSGLVKYMKEEDILGQSLVIVVRLSGLRVIVKVFIALITLQCNLKPATMRGVKSYAMLLCVGNISFAAF
jgi:aminoacyl tRNA synthase complex-interacting multifunctional protein 1